MGFFPVIAHIDLYFDSWEQTVRQNIEVYGKGAKKEANVISYILMTSEWHPDCRGFTKLTGPSLCT